MDGYLIARLAPGEAEEIFAQQQVRHVAELADGNTFVAFDGELPYAGGMILEVEQGAQDYLFPLMPKIRRVTPIDGRTEYLALYTVKELLSANNPVLQVSAIGCDLVLVLADRPTRGTPVWASHSERILDKRLEFTSLVASRA
jgi:hypothetical protein